MLMFNFHTRQRRHALAALLVAGAACLDTNALAQDGDGSDTAAVTELVRKFLDAQSRHDVPALRSLTAEQFVEISPLGEVDPRDKMLGFYVGEASPTRPVIAVDERDVRIFGDSAIVTVKLSFNAGGQARSLRAGFVAHKDGVQWKLVSAQHTPMRPAKP
jgi:ketosteroid isomerase-like protein